MKLTPYHGSVHTHSTFCDGKNTMAEMAAAAYAAGVKPYGFSGHIHTPAPADEGVCMTTDLTAYREEGEIWTTGKVASNQMQALYDGPFGSRERISWKVKVWDENGKEGLWSEDAWFEYALLAKQDTEGSENSIPGFSLASIHSSSCTKMSICLLSNICFCLLLAVLGNARYNNRTLCRVMHILYDRITQSSTGGSQ